MKNIGTHLYFSNFFTTIFPNFLEYFFEFLVFFRISNFFHINFPNFLEYFSEFSVFFLIFSPKFSEVCYLRKRDDRIFNNYSDFARLGNKSWERESHFFLFAHFHFCTMNKANSWIYVHTKWTDMYQIDIEIDNNIDIDIKRKLFFILN